MQHTIVLILFLLPSLLFPILHNHRCDEGDHHDCLACKWFQTQQAVQLGFSLSIVAFLVAWLRPLNGPRSSSAPLALGAIRAPPDLMSA
jgi:hypothetical protein